MLEDNNTQNNAINTAASSPSVEEQSNQVAFVNEMPEIEDTPRIMVLGVGGGGSNAVNNMYKKGINDVDFMVCNTDWQALRCSPVPNKLSIGQHGAGGHPEKGAKHAREHADKIKDICKNSRMIFIAACMGGGTGTGAAPVIAELAKQIRIDDDDDINDILVVAVVTTPFKFEGARKLASARAGIRELRKYADSVIVINNDKLPSLGNTVALPKIFALADDVLYTAVNGIAQLITRNDYINVDFHDVYSIMSGSKTALMGCGIGTGEDRVEQALEAASSSVLLDDQDIHNAKGCLASITYSSEHPITMDEFTRFTEYIQTQIVDGEDAESNVIWGTGTDESLGESVQVTLVATGYENSSLEEIIETISKKETESAKNEGKKVIPLDSPLPSNAEATNSTIAVAATVTVTNDKVEEPEDDMMLIDTSKTNTEVPETPSHEVSATTEGEQPIVHVDIENNDIFIVRQEPATTDTITHATTTEPQAEAKDEDMTISTKTDFVEQKPAQPSSIGTIPTNEPLPKIDTDHHFRARIAKMRELLKKGPAGIEEACNTTEVTTANQSLSSTSEVSNMNIDAQGDIAPSYLFNNPD